MEGTNQPGFMCHITKKNSQVGSGTVCLPHMATTLGDDVRHLWKGYIFHLWRGYFSCLFTFDFTNACDFFII